ncbi:MAG: efflux RND transporter periplasmic adaptor subunit [Acidobacteria bacterium]|nr:efflux RND transporter periplasmic adaptor subunit [Acidobacteriota bacterium]
MALVLLLLSPALESLAQDPPGGPPASPVRYTEAREAPVRRVIQLPGSVESRTSSLVATEVEGLVEELAAREGDVVRLGQPLARLRTTSLELRLRASEAEHKEAKSRHRQAERNLARLQELFDSKIASQSQYDDAQSEHDAWEGKVERLAAEIERIRHDLERSTIVAPFAGTVVAKRTDVGEWLDVGAPVLEMISLHELEVKVDVPERHFSSLNPGATATVTFDALPGLSVSGRISAIIPRADPQARTFPVKVRIGNRDGRIGVGMLAQVSLPAGESYRATVVPKDAVIRQGAEQIVFTINGSGAVERAAVTTGAGLGEWIVVEGPVRPGTKVVTRGNERLQPGQPVRADPLEYRLP